MTSVCRSGCRDLAGRVCGRRAIYLPFQWLAWPEARHQAPVEDVSGPEDARDFS